MRWLRIVALVVGGYLGLVVLTTLLMFAGVLTARLLGRAPEKLDSLPAIGHLRRVDDRLLAGAQPTRADYAALADAGVKVVVDLRTGAPDDPNRDDPEYLASLGMDYVSLPTSDGHAPGAETVNRFIDIVDSAPGLVFMHCGGGVGRSTSLQAAYDAHLGRDPSFLDYLAIGPPTIEQAWFVAAVEPGDPTAGNWFIQGMSRFLDAPRRLWSRARGEL
jgi:protein tyrosine phosphatase (PTP) superfamily phosphohydrolase (DUF442 family)